MCFTLTQPFFVEEAYFNKHLCKINHTFYKLGSLFDFSSLAGAPIMTD
jgi:hypothetical protein